MADGVLYASNGLGFVEAIDPSNGKTVWTQQPVEPGLDGLKGVQSARGVAYWPESGHERILSVRGSYLYALNAKSGTPVADFGASGRVDLRPGLGPETTTFNWVAPSPIIVKDVVIVGGQGRTATPGEATIPPGDIRAYDVRTGQLRWQFHVVPRAGEFGVETWENDSWKYTGSGKAWSAISVDEELGYVYVPTSSAANDWYGGERPGDNLFSDSLLCIDARTGKRVWHYQMVHHDLWDYDNPTAPILGDITVNGRRIKAVIQVTKQAFTFVFDRVTGKPVWPIEERPVPQSTVPGERTVEDAAVSDQAGAVRPADLHGRRSDRFHAGAARGSDRDLEDAVLGIDVHAADAQQQGTGRDAGNRVSARAGSAAPTGAARRSIPRPACSTCRR